MRKLIGFITAKPEDEYVQRVMDGLFSQCRHYGYDVAVFAPQVQVCHFFKNYLNGELNILNLINYKKLDGVILDSISLSVDNINDVLDKLRRDLEEAGIKNVVSLELPLGDFTQITTDGNAAFRAITAHVLDVHHCTDIYMLCGMKDYAVTEIRLQGFLDEMHSRGLEVPEENIFYGDYWYPSGERLAESIASGEVRMPQAVICGSDHMALGLINRLEKLGIKVPEQLVVTGYEATPEGVINDLSLTSYIPQVSKTAAEAVNVIRKALEPDKEIYPAEYSDKSGLVLCQSCGCNQSVEYVRERLRRSLLIKNTNYNDEDIMDKVHMQRILDSYVLEYVSNSKSPDDCLWRIFYMDYLLRPYRDFYLCLRENWLDTSTTLTEGYPDRMRMVIHSVPGDGNDERHRSQFCRDDPKLEFDTELMLPALWEERDVPCVFYFTPVHFDENTFGYSVFVCELAQKRKIDEVFHFWLRNVNTALEMARVQDTLRNYSERDQMTGLMNRRAMENWMNACRERKGFAIVIDMDELKYINDTFGHEEGDFGIILTSKAAMAITGGSDICVRAGGDEFYILGSGEYTGDEMAQRCREFNKAMAGLNAGSGKDYTVSASIGYAVGEGFVELIDQADKRMYEDKHSKKIRTRN